MTHRTVLQIWPIKVDAVMRHDVKADRVPAAAQSAAEAEAVPDLYS